jgi:Sec-independent protein translocase protein TatA
MDILGIGPLELIFILIIALIVLGPKDMVKAGRTLGKFLRQVVTSPTWRAVTRTSSELRTLPNKLIRDATKKAIPTNLTSDLEQWQQDINPWTSPPPKDTDTKEIENSEENSIAPVNKSEEEQN